MIIQAESMPTNFISYINLGVGIFCMLALGAFIYYKLWPAMQSQNDEMKKFLMTELAESKAARTQEIAKFTEIAEAHVRESRTIAGHLAKLNENLRKKGAID